MLIHRRVVATCGFIVLSVALYVALTPDQLTPLGTSELEAINGGQGANCCICAANGCIPVFCPPGGYAWTEAAANANFGVQGGLANGNATCTPQVQLNCTRQWTCALPDCFQCIAAPWGQAFSQCNQVGDCPDS
jgi:hypothetical protein